MPIRSIRFCSPSLIVPGTARPATSPFMSAMNTGTPARAGYPARPLQSAAIMSSNALHVFRPAAVAALAVLLSLPMAAGAQSRRERQAAEGLQQRMDAAETRYREALVRARNGEPGAV